MSFIVVDVEADGAYPGDYSIVSFGAVVVEPSLSKTFYGEVKPISDLWNPQALAISNITREQHLQFGDPKEVMPKFAELVKSVSKGHPVFISDNPSFDWMFMCYYLYKYNGSNPFGFSAYIKGIIKTGSRLIILIDIFKVIDQEMVGSIKKSVVAA